MTNTTNTQRLSFLDTVRGVAALLVVIAHGLESSNIIKIYPTVLGGIQYGSFGVAGVVTFFCVSGFVIPLSLEKSGSQKFFWANRALRIYPLYFVIYFITLALQNFGNFQSVKGFILNLGAHSLFIQEYIKQPNFVGGSWTLSLELFWYIGFSVLFAIGFHKKNNFLVTISIIFSIFALIISTKIHELPMGRLSMLITCLFGLMYYRFYTGEIDGTNFIIINISMITIVVINISFRFLLKGHEGGGQYFWDIAPWVMAYTIFIGAYIFRNSSFVTHKFFLFIGKISYSLYLAHGLVLIILTKLGITGITFLAILFPTAIFLALGFYNFVETPPVKWGHSKLKAMFIKNAK